MCCIDRLKSHFKNPEAFKLWLKRDENKKKKKDVQDEFKSGKLLEFLSKKENEPKIGPIARSLYNHTIDYGAHPNSSALYSMLEIQDDGSGPIIFKQKYVTNPEENPLPLILFFKDTVEIGICSLTIFEKIFKEKFALLGQTEKLDYLKARAFQVFSKAKKKYGNNEPPPLILIPN